MRSSTTLALAALALSACDPSYVAVGMSWSYLDPVATSDGLYVRLDSTGGLVHVRADGHAPVELGPAEVRELGVAPDGATVVALLRRTRCEPEDPRDARGVRTVDDCPFRARKLRGEVAVIRAGEVANAATVGAHYNALDFSQDGRWAIAWLQATSEVDLTGVGVVDLTSVQVIDLESGVVTPVSVGFAASRVLFAADGRRAVVLSKDTVAIIDLTGAAPARSTVFPLTLDAGQTFAPVGMGLTPDGEHVLVAAQGRDDLYALRLDPPSINLINLSGNPVAMAILPPTNPGGDRETDPLARDDRTLLVHQGVARADLVDHETFDVRTATLQSPADRIATLGRTAALWRAGAGLDVHHLDPATAEATRFRLQNSAFDVRIAPGGQRAVALTQPTYSGDSVYSQYPGLEILDFSDDRGRTQPFLLEGQARGLAFAQNDFRLDALVLQDDVEYLLELDVLTATQRQLDLSERPAAIGALPGGGFYITHPSPLGLVTFYDPASGDSSEVSGFAAPGLFEGVPIDDTVDEEEE